MHPDDNQELPPQARQRRSLLKAIGGGALTGGLGLNAGKPARAAQARDKAVLDVAIIGGGLSGLTSARDLQRAGCESFVVLEARDRVGGRTYDHDLGNGIVSEAGGQWIGPGQTAIADLARELEIETFDSYYRGETVFLAGDARVAQDLSHGGAGMNHEVVGKLNQMAQGVPSDAPWQAPNAAGLDRVSVGDWLAQQALSNEDRIGFDTSITLTFGTTPSGLGMLHFLSVLNSADCDLAALESMKGGAQEKRFVGGAQMLSKTMARALGDRVRLSSPVRRIVGWDRDIVELHTDRGVVRARQVIAALHPGLCHRIAFDPPLPEGRARLQQRWPNHAPMRKTVHVYPRPFWREAGMNGQIIPVDSPLIWSYDNSPPDGSLGVINAFVKPGQLPHAPDKAQRILSEIFARALGEAARHPTRFHDHDWGQVDPWSLTCVAPVPPGFWTQWGAHLKPPAGCLIWSGTETADVWAGAMDGAVRAGRRAAAQALHSLARARAGR